MIKKIIQIADIHIPNQTDKRPYDQMLKQAIAEIYKEVKKYNKDEVRIVIVGDIYHQKVKSSKEAEIMCHEMLNYFNAMCKTIVIAGNHDMLENNLDRKDALTPTFSIKGAYSNVIYADKELNYKSGYIIDDGVVWCLYSMFDMFKKPIFDDLQKQYPNHKFVGLYHGEVVGAVTDMGRMSESGIDTNDFKGLDCVMAGHIHKNQTLKKNGIPIVYSGSLIQQDIGENIIGHGYELWDMETMQHQHVEISNDYRMFKLEVTSYDDIKNDAETLLNY
jgi:DNA repair exonuclease SbcCD nuclease subunit